MGATTDLTNQADTGCSPAGGQTPEQRTVPVPAPGESGTVRPQWKSSSRRALALVTATFALLPPFAANAYWHYVNTVPVYRRPPSSGPTPDSRRPAARAVSSLQQLKPSLPFQEWRTAPVAKLAPAIEAAAQPLDQVRRSFARHRQLIPSRMGAESSSGNFLVAAQYFAAESRYRRLQGNAARALRCSVDAMEIGCLTCEDGYRMSGQSCQTVGMEQAERCVDTVPLNGLAEQLARVRRLRLTWPRATDSLVYDQQFALAGLTSRLQVSATQTLWQQLDEVGGSRSNQITQLMPGFSVFGHHWETWKTVLTPHSRSLVILERRFQELKQRASAPVRDGYGPPPLTDHWAKQFDPGQMGGYRWEWPRHNLALLETALAVRLYRLEHGRYPAQLWDLAPKHLPEIPRDAWDQPIAYRLQNGRPVIYSRGRDGVDDGGAAVEPDTMIEDGLGDAVWGKLCTNDWTRKG